MLLFQAFCLHLRSLFCRGVSGDSSVIIICAIFPTFVFIPVSVTIPSACPLTAIVVEKLKFSMSPKFEFSFIIFSAFFSTGMVSPVSADSSTLKLYAFINLTSAGT